MATIRLVPSSYSVSNSSYLSVSSASNMYNNTDNDTYATVTNSRSSTSSYYFYLSGFNFDDVPSDATINSYTVKIKVRESGVTTSTSYRMYLCDGTSTLSDYASTMPSTSVSTISFTSTTSWETLKSYGSDLAIRVNCRRASRSTTAYLYVYGAEIEVDYTLPVSYTVTASIENGTMVSDNPIPVAEGESATLYFKGNDGYTFESMTVDGASVTPTPYDGSSSEEVSVEYSTNYSTYSSYSFDNCHDGDTSTYFWSSEAQTAGKYILITFSTAVDLTEFSTYSSNSTDMPNTNSYLQVSKDGKTWTDVGQFSGETTCTFTLRTEGKGIVAAQIYAKSDISNWLVLNEITMSYTAASIDADYMYTISNITSNKTVVIVFAAGSTGYVKVNGVWTQAKSVWVKGSSGWTESSWDDIKTIFSTDKVR